MDNREKAKPPASDGDALAKAQQAYQKLLTNRQSLMLATVNADGSPLVSYTPFAVAADKRFYIFISTLAQHTANLLRTQQASLMLINDEAATKQIFARQRLTFSCQAKALVRNSHNWQSAASLYEARFGSFFNLIRNFGDFQMFRLTPQEGSLVVGFGQAYAIGGTALDELTLRRG
ncbi:MAG: pyridoxamine 5'-phosphate oxidase family protein [Chloroflexota bacterium]